MIESENSLTDSADKRKNIYLILPVILILLHFVPLLILLKKSDPIVSADSLGYINLAKTLLNDGMFGAYCGQQFNIEAVRMPGYPLFLAFCLLLFGENLWAVVIVQSLLFIASVVLVWRACCITFDNNVGLIFLLISLIYPFIAYSATQILTETLSVFLISAGLFFLAKNTFFSILTGGILISSSYYMRPNLLFLALFIGVAYFLLSRFKNYKHFLVLLLATVLIMIPWTIRNYVTFAKFTPLPIVKGTGVSLFVASWQSRISTASLVEFGSKGTFTPEAVSAGLLAQTEELKREINNNLPDKDKSKTISILGDCDSIEKKTLVENRMQKVAIENILGSPISYLLSSFTNIFRMWFSFYALQTLPFYLNILLVAQGVIFTVLAYIGIILSVKNRAKIKTSAIIFAATMLYFPLTMSLLHTEARYTIPGRLAMLVLVAYTLSVLFSKFNKLFRKSQV